MTAALLAVHVLASIIFIGPVTVATSLFPRYARTALAAGVPGGSDEDTGRSRAVMDLLHRISRVYAVLGLSVPVFGIATAIRMGVMAQAWVIVSLVLTAAAAALLALVVLPRQVDIVDAVHQGSAAVSTRVTARLAMASGIFALTWAVVVVLMILRPGSTTGV
jgi:hypothetical protein